MRHFDNMLFHINILSTLLNIKTDLSICRLKRINIAPVNKSKWQYTGHTISNMVNILLESLKNLLNVIFKALFHLRFHLIM